MKDYKNNKTKWIHIRVTEEQDNRLTELAKDSKSRSEYIRHKLGIEEEN